jgi:rhodanese-related sulfurtransferase
MMYYMILILLITFILYRRNKPVKGLKYIDAETLKHEIETQDELIIIADSERDSKRTARILAKSGFNRRTHLVGGMCAVKQVRARVSQQKKHKCA